jgi:hypothetical protein
MEKVKILPMDDFKSQIASLLKENGTYEDYSRIIPVLKMKRTKKLWFYVFFLLNKLFFK